MTGNTAKDPRAQSRPATPAARLLDVSDLTVHRGNHAAVRRMSFHLDVGEFVAVIGRSGAGKTSLMHALSGLIEPEPGMVHWRDLCQGTCCADLAEAVRHQRRAVMFQHYRLVPQLSALTNVLSGRLGRHGWWRTLAGFPAAEKQRAKTCLAALGLGERMHLRASQLSGGEQQRVAVARALIQDPTLLLADEPVASLDAETANEVMARFRQLNREQGLTIVCVLHDLEMAEKYVDRVLLMDHGMLVHDGPATDLQVVVAEKLQWKRLA